VAGRSVFGAGFGFASGVLGKAAGKIRAYAGVEAAVRAAENISIPGRGGSPPGMYYGDIIAQNRRLLQSADKDKEKERII